MKKLVIVIICLLISTQTKKHCRSESRILNYFKIKSCHRSTLPITFWTNVNKIEECVKVAREKNGLAFNFSPIDSRKFGNAFIISCQVLGCPEIANSSTLVEDVSFDYYSAYGNLTATQNGTCIKNTGLFSTITQRQNYIRSIDLCQKIGADLADVSSEIRTRYLSTIINETLTDWYKVAYVGLNDIEQEGQFVNSLDFPLSCSKFRSWAPGHPISDTKGHNCVVLDDHKMWRVVDCKRKFPVLCEFFPEKPDMNNLNICKNINNNAQKRKCIKKEEDMNKILKNLTRLEQCAILNADSENIANNTQADTRINKN